MPFNFPPKHQRLISLKIETEEAIAKASDPPEIEFLYGRLREIDAVLSDLRDGSMEARFGGADPDEGYYPDYSTPDE